jgi:uncharacterized protein (DUF1330 family)
MKSYFFAQITIFDTMKYEKYLDGFDKVFDKYNGKVIAVDDNPTLLEGSWNHTRFVVIEFPGEDDLKSWYYSSEYQELVKYRLESSKADTIIIHGRK